MTETVTIGGEDFSATDHIACQIIDHLASEVEGFDEGWHARQSFRVLVNAILQAERSVADEALSAAMTDDFETYEQTQSRRLDEARQGLMEMQKVRPPEKPQRKLSNDVLDVGDFGKLVR